MDEKYRIGIEDELQISVWHEAEFSLSVSVRPDGKITLPLVNDIPVVGLSTKELQDLLTEKLKPFVADPQVTIIVRAIHSRMIYLVGQVARPGALPLNSSKTVFQVLVEAGGLSPFAKSNAIYIIRKNPSGQQKLPFNYKKAVKGVLEQDIDLVPGDIIVVP